MDRYEMRGIKFTLLFAMIPVHKTVTPLGLVERFEEHSVFIFTTEGTLCQCFKRTFINPLPDHVPSRRRKPLC
jgi:hypothetical protein